MDNFKQNLRVAAQAIAFGHTVAEAAQKLAKYDRGITIEQAHLQARAAELVVKWELGRGL